MKYYEERRCPKCDNDGVGTQYNNGKLKRDCYRCGYVWHEEPLDATEEETHD